MGGKVAQVCSKSFIMISYAFAAAMFNVSTAHRQINDTSVKFSDVMGADEAKAELQEVRFIYGQLGTVFYAFMCRLWSTSAIPSDLHRLAPSSPRAC